LRLIKFEVEGLYGRFNYQIELGNEDRITILTAPNGFGKTAIINIIHGFFSTNFEAIAKQDFKNVILTFDSGDLVKMGSQRTELPGLTDEAPAVLQVTVTTGGRDVIPWQYDARFDPDELRIDRFLPYIEKVADGYVDIRTSRFMTYYEVQEEYRDELPSRFRLALPVPIQLRAIIDSVECHLIETQRLLKVRMEPRRPGHPQRPPQAVVDQNASDLASKIQTATREYASEAQRLDQSFPQRVLRQLPSSAPSEEELRQNLHDLERKRQDLADAGLVEASFGPFITDYDKMDEASVRNVLNLYARDAAKKLETFDSIYSRIRLFLDIVNDHFKFKRLSVVADKGMLVTDDLNQPIPLTALSSGEQHILVLIYDLLFKVAANALILVDEPELSLHVSWQKRFISDLQKIQQIHPIDVIVATHSPQIINDRWDLVRELGADDPSPDVPEQAA
jgi:predicted ATP-binding protein involved in virulence